jgi:hypothetical protein
LLEEAGVELAAGADDELDELSEPGFELLSVEDEDEPPSLEPDFPPPDFPSPEFLSLDAPSFGPLSDFGAGELL